MAKQRRALKDAEDILLNGGKEDSLPIAYKVGRDAYSYLKSECWADSLDVKYNIGGQEKRVTALDAEVFTLAISQTLHNQSMLCDNEEGTGIGGGIPMENNGETAALLKSLYGYDTPVMAGQIIVSINDLCRFAYGCKKPTKEQRLKMGVMINALHSRTVTMTVPSGNNEKPFKEIEVYLITMMSREPDGSTNMLPQQQTSSENIAGSRKLHLIVNPLFCSNIKKSFGVIEQDSMEIISREAPRLQFGHVRMLKWCSTQDARKPKTLTMPQLVKETRTADDYEINRKRTEKNIMNILEVVKKTGIIKTIKPIKAPNGRYIDRVLFTFNPEYGTQKRLVQKRTCGAEQPIALPAAAETDINPPAEESSTQENQ